MPSVLGLMEQREARARQDLESWTEVLEQAQAEVDAARERLERARVGREELVVVAAPGPVNGVELTRAVGREAEVKNEVEKIRHRAYVLQAGLAGAGGRRTVHARAWGCRSGRLSGQRGASPARRRDSLIVAAHHTICWW